MIFFMNFFYMNSKCILWLLSLNIFIFLDIELKYIVICLLENLYVFLKKKNYIDNDKLYYINFIRRIN